MLCSQLIPSGPNYKNVSLSNQICNAAGAIPGHLYVNGDAYVKNNTTPDTIQMPGKAGVSTWYGPLDTLF